MRPLFDIRLAGDRACGLMAASLAVALFGLLLSPPLSADESIDAAVVAKIGDRTVTRGDFDSHFDRQAQPATAELDSVKTQFLESLIHKELLVLEARDRGMFGPDPEIDASVKEFGDDLLRTWMSEEETRVDSTVTDEQVAEAFERTLQEFRISHILHWSRAALDSARQRIDGGELFSEVATETTTDPRSAPEGGLLPWLNDRHLIPEFRQALADLEVGEVVGPFQSIYGWHLAVIDSLRDRAGADLETERESLRSDILAERIRARSLEFDRDFRERYKFVMNVDTVVSTVREAEASYRAASIDSTMAGRPIAELWTPEDPEAVFFRYKGGSFTAADYHQLLLDEGLGMHWSRVQPGAVLALMRETFNKRAKVIDARRRGLDQDEDWKRRVELRREELVVDRLYQDVVMGDFITTEADERKYWEEHRDQFYTLEVFRYAYIQVGDAAVAQALVEQMEGIEAAEFDSLVNSLQASGHLIGASRDSGRRSPSLCGAVPEAARNMMVGEVGHVVESDGVHTVFNLMQYEPRKLDPFEKARDRVQRTLRNIHSEETLNALLEGLEEKYGVERYPERLGLSGSG